jgi:hypothetical protein
MPKNWLKKGQSFEFGGQRIVVKDNHFLIRVAKQRGNLPAGRIFLCWIDYKTHKLSVVTYD